MGKVPRALFCLFSIFSIHFATQTATAQAIIGSHSTVILPVTSARDTVYFYLYSGAVNVNNKTVPFQAAVPLGIVDPKNGVALPGLPPTVKISPIPLKDTLMVNTHGYINVLDTACDAQRQLIQTGVEAGQTLSTAKANAMTLLGNLGYSPLPVPNCPDPLAYRFGFDPEGIKFTVALGKLGWPMVIPDYEHGLTKGLPAIDEVRAVKDYFAQNIGVAGNPQNATTILLQGLYFTNPLFSPTRTPLVQAIDAGGSQGSWHVFKTMETVDNSPVPFRAGLAYCGITDSEIVPDIVLDARIVFDELFRVDGVGGFDHLSLGGSPEAPQGGDAYPPPFLLFFGPPLPPFLSIPYAFNPDTRPLDFEADIWPKLEPHFTFLEKLYKLTGQPNPMDYLSYDELLAFLNDPYFTEEDRLDIARWEALRHLFLIRDYNSEDLFPYQGYYPTVAEGGVERTGGLYLDLYYLFEAAAEMQRQVGPMRSNIGHRFHADPQLRDHLGGISADLAFEDIVNRVNARMVIESDPATAATRASIELSGDLQGPVIANQALGDPLSMLPHSRRIMGKVATAGKSHLLTQVYNSETNHCVLNSKLVNQTLTLMEGLHDQLNNGNEIDECELPSSLGFVNNLPVHIRNTEFSFLPENLEQEEEIAWSHCDAQAEFLQGVASGDVETHLDENSEAVSSVMLWTRVDKPIKVTAQISEDPELRGKRHIRRAAATLDHDFTVKTAVKDLKPGTQYYYRFKAGKSVSEIGTFKTPPDPRAESSLRFAWSGDSDGGKVAGVPIFNNFEVLDRAREEGLDFWIYEGDTIYSDVGGFNMGSLSAVYDLPSVLDVPDSEKQDIYRDKYKENRSYSALRALLGSTSTYAIWSDHEVHDGFSGLTSDPFLVNLGRQTFLDYMPFRHHAAEDFQPGGTGFYQKIPWGKDVEIYVLDTRSFRTGEEIMELCTLTHITLPNNLTSPVLDIGPTLSVGMRSQLAWEMFLTLITNPATQPLAGLAYLGFNSPEMAPLAFQEFFKMTQIPGYIPVPPAVNPTTAQCSAAFATSDRSLLGPEQKNALITALDESQATWKIVVSAEPMAGYFINPYDAWEAFGHERSEILSEIRDRGIENVVVLAADFHTNIINDISIHRHSDDPLERHVVAKEFVAGPIATGSQQQRVDAQFGPVIGNFVADKYQQVSGTTCFNATTYGYGVVEFDATDPLKRLNVTLKSDIPSDMDVGGKTILDRKYPQNGMECSCTLVPGSTDCQ